MAVFGKLYAFDCKEEDWKTYIQRAKLYFTANVIRGAKKKAIILNTCGPKTFQMIKNIATPRAPEDLTWAEPEETIQGHYNPKPTATIQRCLFNSRIRKPEESITQFVAALKKLSEHCGFSEATLNDVPRDCLICGINK